MKPVILLQKKNGLDISPTYDNNVRCAELVSTITKDLQDCEVSKVKDLNTENEAVYIRYVRDGEPVNSLVCLSEVSHAHADGIVDCIGTSMVQFGLEN